MACTGVPHRLGGEVLQFGKPWHRCKRPIAANDSSLCSVFATQGCCAASCAAAAVPPLWVAGGFPSDHRPVRGGGDAPGVGRPVCKGCYSAAGTGDGRGG